MSNKPLSPLTRSSSAATAVKLAVTFPGYSRLSYIAVCRGHERIADLLDFFVYQASLRKDKQERCNVVTFPCSHKDILEKLPIHLSRKTLISYLDALNAWGYVRSERYGRVYSVDISAIQAAVNHPPESVRRVKTGGRQKCDASHPAELARCESCKVVRLKLSEMEQNVVRLKLYVSSLELKVSQLQQYVSNVQLYNLPSAPSEMPLEGQSEKAPVFTDSNCHDTDSVCMQLASANVQHDEHTHSVSLLDDGVHQTQTPQPQPQTVSSSTCDVETPELPPIQERRSSAATMEGETMRERTHPTRSASPASPEEVAVASEKPTGKGRRRKPKAPKVEPVAPERIEEVIACMEGAIRELTGESDFTYARTKKAADDVADLLRGRTVAPVSLTAVMTRLYETPPDKRTGFDWKEHMTIAAICRNYDRVRVQLAASPQAAAARKYANPATPDGSWPDGKYFDDGTFLQPGQRPGESIEGYMDRQMREDGERRLRAAMMRSAQSAVYVQVQA
jgi:hypothetical protein